MFSSPLLSSHRPKTEFAAANTAQREFKVVVIPAYKNAVILSQEFSYLSLLKLPWQLK